MQRFGKSAKFRERANEGKTPIQSPFALQVSDAMALANTGNQSIGVNRDGVTVDKSKLFTNYNEAVQSYIPDYKNYGGYGDNPPMNTPPAKTSLAGTYSPTGDCGCGCGGNTVLNTCKNTNISKRVMDLLVKTAGYAASDKLINKESINAKDLANFAVSNVVYDLSLKQMVRDKLVGMNSADTSASSSKLIGLIADVAVIYGIHMVGDYILKDEVSGKRAATNIAVALLVDEAYKMIMETKKA